MNRLHRWSRWTTFAAALWCLTFAQVADAQQLQRTGGGTPRIGTPRQQQSAPPQTPAADEGGRSLPFQLHAHVTLRYDNFIFGDPLDLLGGPDYAGGFRTKVRLWANFGDSGADGDFVHGRIRLVVGENPNPAASFVRLGDVSRTTAVGFDQYFFTLRPFTDRRRLEITLGKMANPFFVGDGFSSELVFDTDINPTGVALSLRPLTGDISLFAHGAYYVVQDIENFRFQGESGVISHIMGQVGLKVRSYVELAATYHHFRNLNSGLNVAGVVPGDSVDLTGQNAFLFRTRGLQATNNRINYGPGADGFTTPDWHILQGTAQLSIARTMGRGLPYRVYVLGDVIYNFSPSREGLGLAGTVGFSVGSKSAHVLPISAWFTYRYVEPDATLAAFADADLGGGTDYRGLEVGARVHLHEQVSLSAAYFDYRRWPDMIERVQRIFFDATWEY